MLTFYKDIKEEIQNGLEIVFGDNGVLESVNGFRIVNLMLHFCKHSKYLFLSQSIRNFSQLR